MYAIEKGTFITGKFRSDLDEKMTNFFYKQFVDRHFRIRFPKNRNRITLGTDEKFRKFISVIHWDLINIFNSLSDKSSKTKSQPSNTCRYIIGRGSGGPDPPTPSKLKKKKREAKKQKKYWICSCI